MSYSNLPMILSYQPRTFCERGVTAPFTTPLLCGARLRRAPPPSVHASERSAISALHDQADRRERPTELEIVVPNPSGGRGVYILPWSKLSALCRPTLHDALLGQAVASNTDPTAPLTPSGMRAVAWETARQGAAGRAAKNGAESAAHQASIAMGACRFELLVAAIRAVDPAADLAAFDFLGGQHQDGLGEIQRRGHEALSQLAARMGQPATKLVDLLDLVARLLVDVGVGAGAPDAHVPKTLAALTELRRDVIAWAQGDGSDIADAGGFELAKRIASSAELAITMARRPLAAIRDLAEDFESLMRAALHNPTALAELFGRPAWILDGWDRICLIWQSAPALMERPAALQEILRQLPILPDEAELWLDLPPGTTLRLNGRAPPPDKDWRDSATILERIARNEQLSAVAG